MPGILALGRTCTLWTGCVYAG